MRAAVPHQLPREEIRRRLREQSHKIADHIPGGMAQVETSWPNEDRMNLAIQAMGQKLVGHIDIEDSQLVVDIDLPPMLSFLAPMIEGAVKSQGHKLLGPR